MILPEELKRRALIYKTSLTHLTIPNPQPRHHTTQLINPHRISNQYKEWIQLIQYQWNHLLLK